MRLLVEVHIFGYVACRVNHLLALVKLYAVLAIVAKLHGFAYLEVALVGSEFSQQQLDEGGLAHAVVAHNAQFLVACKGVVQILENHLVAKPLADVVCGKNLLAYVGRFHIQFHFAIVVAALRTLLQVVESIDAVLCLVHARLRLAAHPLELGAQQVAGALHSSVLCLDALGAFLQIVVVIALVAIDLLLVEFQNAVAYLVEEVAVVGHHEQGDVAAAQEVLEPLNHVDVEVVGRLVEDEQLWVVDENLGKRHAFHLASREGAYAGIEVIDLELRENLLETGLVVPSIGTVHAFDGSGHRIAVATFQGFFVGLHRLAAAVVAREAGIDNGEVPVEVGRLLQIAHTQVVAVSDGAAVVLVIVGYDAQQRRFSKSVFGNQAYLVALVDAEADVLEQHIHPKRLGQILNL